MFNLSQQIQMACLHPLLFVAGVTGKPAELQKDEDRSFAALRYNAGGSLDPDFGTGGVVTTTIDDDGYLFLSDRKIDMIISGGANIYPAEIEGELINHPAVQDVAVFGIPNADWGEEIKAVVALAKDQSVTEEQLIAFCKERLAAYKYPRIVEFVEELPKGPTGKILKRELS